MLALLAAALLQEAGAQPLARIVVTEDDTVVDQSCWIAIPAGTVLEDRNGNGVIQIAASFVTVVFEPGSALVGAAPGTPWDRMNGYGIRVREAAGVTVRGARVSGYRGGLWATAAPGLTVEDAVFADNFRQRLRSTERAEDGADWLWPHNNDRNEWLVNYGAAVYVEDSAGVTARRVRVRRGQNGICLDRVNDSCIYDNDCSFLSGWGLALWRSSGNVVSRNAFDFCVRGYSHGVYSRGQDSAGILVFEQCSGNVFAENSATHGGDGFFGFAGREALGESPAPAADFTYERRGCNDNLLVGNDFSDAAANGIELTFSFGNRILDNVLSGGTYGLWAGYSQATVVQGNVVEENQAAGVAIEHGSHNRIARNRFARNARGVELWWDEDTELLRTPWARANDRGLAGNVVAHNAFDGDRVGVELRRVGQGFQGEMSTVIAGNGLENVPEPLRLVGDAAPPKLAADAVGPPEDPGAYPVLGATRPAGARGLRGRHQIVMTEWGPWDHEGPLLLRSEDRGGVHLYRLLGVAVWPECELLEADEGVSAAVSADPQGGPGAFLLEFSGARPGLARYRARVRAPGLDDLVAGTLLSADWEVRVFSWTADPRLDLEGWRAEAQGRKALVARAPALHLRYGYGGPSQVGLSDAVSTASLPADRFGTLAAATVPLEAGRYRIATISDDGVRVLVGGQVLLERWDVHGPTRDEAEFELGGPADVEIRVEHFENDGYALLELELEPLPRPQ